MNFVTLEFATFFLFVLVAGWLLRERDGEYRAFLLVCNLFFYALAGMAFVPLLLAVAVLNWGAVHLMSRFSGQPRKRKGVIALDVALHVALLAFFKYYEFLILGLESLASAAGLDTGILRHALPSMEILFPVGLSFYTFQGLSYAIDHYRCPDEPPRAFLDVLLFVSFFPTIMAGPIMRARQFLPQLGHRTWDSRDLQEGFALILSGLFKKVVIASYLSEHIVRDVFESPEFYSSWTILAAGAAIQVLTGLPAAWGVFQQPVMEEYGLSEQGAGLAFGIHGTVKTKTRVFAASAVYCGNTAIASKQNNCPLRVFTWHKFGIVNQCSAVIVRIRVKRGIDFCSGTQKLVQTHAENLCGTGQHKVNIVAVLFRYCVSELNLFFECGGILFIGDPAVFVHLSKHRIAPSERFFGVKVRGIG